MSPLTPPESASLPEARYWDRLALRLKEIQEKKASSMQVPLFEQRGIGHIVFFYPYLLMSGGASSFQTDVLEGLWKSQQNLVIEMVYLNLGQRSSRAVFQEDLRGRRIILHGIPSQHPDGRPLNDKERAQRFKTVLEQLQVQQKIDGMANNNSTTQFEMSNVFLEFGRDHGIPTHFYFHGGEITKGIRHLVRHSDAAVTNSDSYRELFSRLGMQVEVVPPVVDASYFLEPLSGPEQGSLAEWVRTYGLEGKKVVLHPGVLKPEKGQEDLIAAALQIKEEDPGLSGRIGFVIAGRDRTGKEQDRLAQLAQGAEVLFVGDQTKEQMRLWYHLADLVVCPSRWEEPFGLVSVEAQASGAPVIVTAVGGLVETLLPGETGVVAPPRDSARLAQEIRYLISNEERRCRMAAAARRHIERRYPPEKTLSGQMDSYLKAFERSPDASGGRLKGQIPRAPLFPERILFNPYRGTDRTREGSALSAQGIEDLLVGMWRALWDRQLEAHRPFWSRNYLSVRGTLIPYGYSSDSPAIAYDPETIFVRSVGPYRLIAQPPIPEILKGRVTWEEAESAQGSMQFNVEIRRMFDDPLHPDFVVLAGAFPKVRYDSLLVSRTWRPQELTEEVVQMEMEWARRGVVSEFHRPESFLGHLHVHLNLPETLPIYPFATTFSSEQEHGGVQIGTLAFPPRHIALSSSNPTAVKKAALLLGGQLRQEGQWFNQAVMPVPQSDRILVLFFLFKETPEGFGFSTIGVLKSSDLRLEDSVLIEKVDQSFLDSEAMRRLRDEFWTRWKVLPQDAADGESARIARIGVRAQVDVSTCRVGRSC